MSQILTDSSRAAGDLARVSGQAAKPTMTFGGHSRTLAQPSYLTSARPTLKMLIRSALLVGLAVLAIAPPTIARASAFSAFHTPGWAAQCYVPAPYERALSQTVLVCVTPNDGFTISMGAHSRPRWHYDRKARGYRDYFSAQRLLRFGQYWAVRPYWYCASKTTGLTCWNKAGHGWWVGRHRGYRTF